MAGGVTQETNVGLSGVGFKLSLTGLAKELLDPSTLSQLLEEALEFGERRAKGVVPYDTGELSDSIGHRVTGLKGELYATADHAAPVEYGHRTRGGTFVSARPYLRPSADEAFDYLEKLIQRHAEKVLSANKLS